MVGDKQIINQKKVVFIISSIDVNKRQGASFARILAYTKALTTDKNVLVYLLSTENPLRLKKSGEEIIKNAFICGERNTAIDKSSFRKRTSQKVFTKEEFGKFLENVAGFLDSFNEKRTVLVYPSINNCNDEKKLLSMVKSKKIPIFSERNELNIGRALNNPFPDNPIKKILFGFYLPFKILDFYRQDKLVKLYNGNIVISTTMEKKVAKMNKNLIRIPILADMDKFSKPILAKNKEDYINIGFTGTLNIKKDGIDDLIKAIDILGKKYGIENVKLNLYGTGYHGTIAKLSSLISDLGLQNRIIMQGNVSSEKIPNVLSKQDILILARPVNLQTKFGFSTKLAEYMASGVAVVCTDVSDNALYIKDGINGFIAKSHHAEQLADKLNEVISQKKYLDFEIREKAHDTAHKYFNSLYYSEKLRNFLLS